MSEEQKKGTLLIESQLFPNITFYKTLIKCEKLLLEQWEHYQKVSFRNRYYIAGPNGRILLSVPLTKGKNQRTLVRDVKISNEEKWQDQHWKTLVSSYRRSPWFEYYEDELRPLFEQPFERLLDWNLACFDWVNKRLGLELSYTLTDEYVNEYLPESGVTDARNTHRPGDKNAQSIDLPVYTQVFGERTGFLPNLSILDLLFCEGKQAIKRFDI
ncbi:WbqC-like protein family protein [Chitinophaga costaii]|uniref:WbqC-like protein family protein n=1 Tax=Chitinophaga costaii TaxID=1335309 RepID=A0A1C4E5Q3_9BACT|nr:WbqC family protein [Chitinophaga costaii]PUZ24305.1 hypothetical protein DCM91_12805 [Chitinophaga costaii]SCC38976.1 WbqC-like protein family protein [Chitinophaga costaii]